MHFKKRVWITVVLAVFVLIGLQVGNTQLSLWFHIRVDTLNVMMPWLTACIWAMSFIAALTGVTWNKKNDGSQ